MGRALLTKAAAAALASLLLSAGPLRGGQRDPSAQTLECLRAYRAAIEDYRAKRTDGAVAALSSLDHEQLTLIVRRLEMIRSSQQRTSDKTDALFAWDRQTLRRACCTWTPH